MFDTGSPIEVGDFDMQRVKTMFDTSAGRDLPSSKFATIKFDTMPRAFRSHVTGCNDPGCVKTRNRQLPGDTRPLRTADTPFSKGQEW